MNKHQRIVLGIGLLLVILNGLFLPFEGKYGRTGDNLTAYLGYRFLFSPPSQAEVFRTILGQEPPATPELNLCSSYIITSRFIVQLVTVITVTIGAVFLVGKRYGETRTNTPDKTSSLDERDTQSAVIQPVPANAQTSVPQVMIPESVAKELRENVFDFVSKEFRESGPQVRDQAVKFIFDRLRLAAQHHFSERQTMDGFRDAEQLRVAAAKFKELTTARMSLS